MTKKFVLIKSELVESHWIKISDSIIAEESVIFFTENQWKMTNSPDRIEFLISIQWNSHWSGRHFYVFLVTFYSNIL